MQIDLCYQEPDLPFVPVCSTDANLTGCNFIFTAKNMSWIDFFISLSAKKANKHISQTATLLLKYRVSFSPHYSNQLVRHEGSELGAFCRNMFGQLCLWCRFTCSSATSTGHIRLTVATSKSLSSRSPHPVHTGRGKLGKEAKIRRSVKQWNSLLAKNCIGMKRLIRNYRFMHLSTSLNFNVVSGHR